ncbi:hypothetical protein FA15DRAFT_635314 [Coprinopsis marcescibilis]|uniref:F-box domain-containing protein n=1 Tax=Coprinopsis marcescibilis TaxID=230819 RepID=A0A5C3LGP1_COPMA|nr:hypothetical protein FA15DRAFT_635314 [Coprinopsis marcescibilis]
MPALEITQRTTGCLLRAECVSVSSIEVLPLEVLYEIFMLCLPGDFRIVTCNIAQVAPLQLCHVSKAWRRASMNECRLWRNLKLPTKRLEEATTPEGFTDALSRITSLAAFWIQNAGDPGVRLVLNIPLPSSKLQMMDIASQLFHNNPSNPTINTTATTFMEAWMHFTNNVLVNGSPHIKDLELIQPLGTTASHWMPSFLSTLLPYDFKQLESVMVRGTQIIPSQCPGCRPGLFGSMPNLKKVALVYTGLSSSAPSMLPESLLPWRQLTHLMIKTPCSGSFWKRILMQCTQLEACIIHIEHSIVDGDDDPLLPSSGIELVRLHHLDLTFHDDFTSIYLHDFHFPNLQTLIVSCDIGNGFPTFTWLPITKTHLFPQLHNLISFTLSYQNLCASDLLELLGETPNLEELIVDSYLADHKGFLKSLTVYPNGTRKPLVPKLRAFSLFLEYYADTPPTSFEEEDFLVMMASRSVCAAAIAEHVCIMTSKNIDGIYSPDSSAPSVLRCGGTNESALVHVELWIDTEEWEWGRFDLLEKFAAKHTMYLKDAIEAGVQDLPPFSFSLDFNSPSQWLLQSNEPVWYNY